jgi:hypothetical protein
MASHGRQTPRRGLPPGVGLLALAAAAFAAAFLALAALAASAGAEVVYDNAPAPGAAEVPPLSFEQSGTAELGSLLQLAGGARLDPTVRVEIANEGEAVSAPVTLSVYAPAADRGPGQLLARETETFELAGEPPLQPIELSFPGLTLPAEAIFSVAFDSESLGLALAGAPATGASPREAEGVYRAASAEGVASPLAFEADPLSWQGRQPAFTIEAASPPPAPTPALAAAPAGAAVAGALTRSFRHPELSIPPSKRMSLSFPRSTALIAGPGALVQVECGGSSAARCVGTLSLRAAGAVHKAPFSIGRGRRQYVVVPLGSDLRRLDGLGGARATATASTVQVGGAAVKTRRALKLK